MPEGPPPSAPPEPTLEILTLPQGIRCALRMDTSWCESRDVGTSPPATLRPKEGDRTGKRHHGNSKPLLSTHCVSTCAGHGPPRIISMTHNRTPLPTWGDRLREEPRPGAGSAGPQGPRSFHGRCVWWFSPLRDCPPAAWLITKTGPPVGLTLPCHLSV